MSARLFSPRHLAAVVALALLAPLLPSSGARAQDADTTRKQLEAVRRQRAAAASQVDALKADQADVARALDALDENVRGQQALYANAIRKADDAAAELARAEQQVTAQRALVDALAASARKAALEAYIDPPADMTESIAGNLAPSEAVVKRVMAGMQAGHAVDVLDSLQKAQEDLERAQKVAQWASDKADKHRQAAGERLVQLESALEQHRSMLDTVDDRLDRVLGESAALAAMDANLSATLYRQLAELAARAAAARALYERAGGRSRSSGSYDVSEARVVSVRGTKVAASIAGQVEAMYAAAAEAGLRLGGSGYRSPAGQIAIRRSHCGTSSYAIYQMSPSRCRPPAARPGRSMHEKGLAIDITCDGALITSRGNRCFQWLARNASRFGFYNLPSEPWHWSVNGN